jgi:predicted Zn-dependent peptidase
MKNGKFTIEDIKKAVLTYKNSMVEISETPDGLISLYSGIEYLNSDTLEDRIKKIESVTKDDIMALANKLILDTIFFLEGGEQSANR